MKKIKVYSTPTCPYCHLLKDYLKEHKMEFDDIDVSVDQKAAKEMVDKSGQMGVPVIAIDDKYIVGFDKEKIDSVLKIK